MSFEELAREAENCVAAGASAFHLHVRDDDGGHILDARRYVKATAVMRDRIGQEPVIQITTEAVGMYCAPQQMDCVRAVKPQAVSLALKEIVPDAGSEEAARAFFVWMQNQNIAPQFILYEAGEVVRFFDLQKRGVVPNKTPLLLFVLGRYARDQQSGPQDLDPFLVALGDNKAHWAMCAFGRREAECAVYAAGRGGHIRIGFENNLLMPDGAMAPSNAALVEVVAGLLKAENIAIASPLEARQLLSLSLR
jgi:uncharacterized protein (DUF849 family)